MSAPPLQQEHLPRIFLRYHGIADPLPDRAVAGCLDGWLLYWHASGQVQVSHAGNTLRADRRHILLRSPHCQIARHSLRPSKALWFHLQLGLPADQLRNQCLLLSISDDLQRQFTGLLADLERDAIGTCMGFAARLRFLALLSQSLAVAPDDLWQPLPADARLAEMLQFMHLHYYQRHDNAALARRIDMSCNAFIRLFSQSFGMSPQRYLMQLRLEEAAQLLSHSSLSIDAIAEQLAFIDRSHLSRRFKHHYGVTPAQLRGRQVLLV